MEEKKEPTAAEKLNAEGNLLCTRVGYHRHLARLNSKMAEELEVELDKIAKKMNNIPKEEVQALKEQKVEARDGTDG